MLPAFINKFVEIYHQQIRKANLKEAMQAYKSQFQTYLSEIIEKSKNLGQTNFDLGVYHYTNGALNDAILRFKIAKYFEPKFVSANYYLGRSYCQLYKYDKARYYLEEYLKSNDKEFSVETNYCLNIINNQPTNISSIPLTILRARFEQLFYLHKDKGNNFITDDLKANQTLFSLLNKHLMQKAKLQGNYILDVACGTGILGKFSRSQKIASQIIGVELSPSSAKYAADLNVDELKAYDKVEIAEANEYLNNYITTNTAKFDVIFASNYITYNPNLEEFFQNTSKVLKEDGLLGITFLTDETNDISFKTIREQFHFSIQYVKTVATKYNLKALAEEDSEFLNSEKGKVIIFNK
jgi:predicted TPR repeat methyltransferase